MNSHSALPQIQRSGPGALFSQRLWQTGLLVAAVTLFTGCAVGPDFRSPVLPEQAGYRADDLPVSTASAEAPTGAAQRLVEGAQVPARWWEAFASAELNRRVEQALANSPDIASAQAALRQAQAQTDVTRGGLFPSVDAVAGSNRQQNPLASGPVSGSASPYTVYNASVDVGYTLDLFGGVRRSVEAQGAYADIQRYQLQGTFLSLAANVVTTSIREASLRGQIRANEEITRVYQEQFELTERQYDTGVKSQGEVLFARSQVAAARAQLPTLKKLLNQTQTQLAVYLGQFPSEAEFAELTLEDLQLPLEIPVSLPSAVVRTRPDVLAAEANLHQATAAVGIATANLFPNIVLSASLGSQALERGDLFGGSTEAWSLGLNLLQPIFRGGSLRAQKRAAEAGLDQASADYRSTVLTAFQNVADSLRALELDAESLASRAAALEATAESLAIARRQYEDGSIEYLQVLIESRLFEQSRVLFIEARANRLADTAAMYTALGGNFSAGEPIAQDTVGTESPQ
ncbi:efflux transporter outer membrane subunit [Dokdonella sp.]|uniref:efflux transporter outer membrane subunit n=1 Tax=Dokdonella sp. TaxID=2291710 RepID=UPI003C501687